MIVIIGCIIVIGAVLGGFTLAGGKIPALIQPAELVVIFGAAIGALIVMSPKKVLVDIVRGLVQCVKGTPYNKRAYEDLFKMLYELFRLARRDGLMALESHLIDPPASAIFSKYPKFTSNQHAMSFLTGALTPIVDGTVKPEQLPGLLEADIKLIEEEHHAPAGVMTKTADALPGFGIVAAVLGIVVTMSAIDGPVEEIGEKVAPRWWELSWESCYPMVFSLPWPCAWNSSASRKSAFCTSLLPPCRDSSAICLPRWPSNRRGAAW